MRIVLSGGPGAGKTALLEELRHRGYACSAEVARRIIQQQVGAGGDALPWAYREKYARLMLEASVESWKADAIAGAVTFFDRGIPDTLCYARLVGLSTDLEQTTEECCRQYRYWHRVFLAPPWREIYETDAERKQDFEEAIRTYDLMARTYAGCGYEVVPLPLTPVAERADFVLAAIANG
ncbi:MAG TPA: AAA family ATPase [Edaphobacter sp.]|nr:AAA family ATPase [Edaphobacter sp.]